MYAYVWMNYDSRKAYTTMFQALFDALGEAVNEPIRFQHIHNRGIATISVDMCNKQAGGK